MPLLGSCPDVDDDCQHREQMKKRKEEILSQDDEDRGWIASIEDHV